MKDLNPTIKTISDAFAFKIKWCETLEKWIITNTSSCGVEFYWSSSSGFEDSDEVVDFLEDFSTYHYEIGAQSARFQ